MDNKKIESITIDGQTYAIDQMSESIKRLVKTYENTLEKARKAEEESLVYNAAIQQLGPAIVNAVREEAMKALKQKQLQTGTGDQPPAEEPKSDA